jgi:hypothetical protein
MLVPLPGAHVTLVVGRAWRYRHDTDLGARLELAAELHRLMASAKSVAGAVSAPVEKKEVVPWP